MPVSDRSLFIELKPLCEPVHSSMFGIRLADSDLLVEAALNDQHGSVQGDDYNSEYNVGVFKCEYFVNEHTNHSSNSFILIRP